MTGLSNKENVHEISLYGEQQTLWDAFCNSKKNVIAVVPVGSGKSFLCATLLPIIANTPSMHMGRDVCYVAPSSPMLDRIIWGPLKKVCLEQYHLQDERDVNNSKKTITFKNGIKIHCISAQTGLKGINASVVIADEAAEFDEESLMELSNRIRPAVGSPNTKGRMILVSTPEGKNQFYKFYEEALRHPDEWIVIHKNYLQMKSQSKKWIESQKYLLSPMKFARDFMCDWGSIEDQFFYAWKKSMLVAETTDRNKDLYTFHDFNKKLNCAIVAQVVGDPFSSSGQIEILKSYALLDCGTEQLAIAIRKDFPKRELKAVMDMSGAQVMRDTTSVFGVTDRTILEKYGFRIQNSKKSNPFISDTDNSSNAFINQNRLKVPIYETNLVSAIETYHYEDGNRKALVKYSDAKTSHIDGLGDALRYGIHHLFPMQHYEDEHQVQMYIDSDSRHYRAPGSEYTDHLDRDPVTGAPTVESIIKDMLRDVGQGDEQDQYWT